MGRNKKYKTEEERLEAKRKREAEYYQNNKLKRSLYYKERYKKLKDIDSDTFDEDHALDEVMNNMVDDISYEIQEDVTYIPDGYDESGDYEGNII